MKEKQSRHNYFPQDYMCAKRKLISPCVTAQPDQSLFCPPIDALDPWLTPEGPEKTLIRLRECAVWSESSLGASLGANAMM